MENGIRTGVFIIIIIFMTIKWLDNDPIIGLWIRNMPTSKVSMVHAFRQHLSYVFQHLQAGLEFYDQQRWKRLRWKAYIEKQKALHKFCKRLTGGDENTV